MIATDQQDQQLDTTSPAYDPGAIVTVSIMGSDGLEVTITNENGQPFTAETVLIKAAAALGLTGFKTSSVGVVRNGQPAQLDTPVQPGDLVSAAPRVSNG